jgi:hypothetical protein
MTDSVAGGVLANTCAAVSGGAYADFVGVDLPLQTVSFFDPANGVTADLSGAQLQYLNGPACASNPLKKTQFNINIFCDPNTLFDYNPIANVTDPCAPSVQVISKVGCPLISPDIIMEWLAGVEKFFGIFFIGGGIFLCFFGFQLIGPTVCIIGLLTGVIVTMLIWYTFFFSADINTKQIWIFLGIGVVVGVALGLLLMKYPKIGAGMAAGYGGAVGGIMVNTILLSSFGWSWTMYACAVIAGGIAVWLSWKFYDPAIIGATGLIGAYALVRGISMYAGGWVSEKNLADLISSGQFDQIPTVYFGYLAGFVIVGTCGILFQRKRLARKQAREKVRRLRIN